jgi:Holliday junction resolvase
VTTRVGTQYEAAVLAYLREHGTSAERLAKAGKNDEGDLVYLPPSSRPVVMELKVRRNQTTGLSLGSLHDEAVVEAERYGQARSLNDGAIPALVVKRVRKSVARSFVVLSLEDFVEIMESKK